MQIQIIHKAYSKMIKHSLNRYYELFLKLILDAESSEVVKAHLIGAYRA